MSRATAIFIVATAAAGLERHLDSKLARNLHFINCLEKRLATLAQAWPHANPIDRARFSHIYERAQRERRELIASMRGSSVRAMGIWASLIGMEKLSR